MTVTTAVSSTEQSAVQSLMLKEPARSSVARGSTPEVRATVEAVIADIRERGDEAVREYSQKFDRYRSGDVRAAKYRGTSLPWSDHNFGN